MQDSVQVEQDARRVALIERLGYTADLACQSPLQGDLGDVAYDLLRQAAAQIASDRKRIAEHTRLSTPAEVDDDVCANGKHCCCCGPGDPCCDCGAIMPDREELPALRKALSDLLSACQIADAKEDLSSDIDGELMDAAAEALELQYPIIWTADQVAMLEDRQAMPMMHPYTCGKRSDTEELRVLHQAQADEDGDAEAGLLFPTRRGWRCPACDYRQFWSHETGGAALIGANSDG